VFLILSHPSGSSGVIGWELELDVTASPSVLVSNLEIRGGSIQVIPEWDGRADLLEMLPPADAIVLASFKILLLASIEHPLFIGPVEQSTLLDDPCYWDISAPETPIALNHFMGTWAAPVAWINWFSPNEPTSWSRVKALYGG
jgi:hypothetical protein